jgi:hypothetical protein
MFRCEPFFTNNKVWNRVLKQMKTHVVYVRKHLQPRDDSKVNDRIKWTNDLLKFTAKHRFRVPAFHTPTEVHSEEHLAEVARLLEAKGALNGKKFSDNMPHQDLIVLDYDDPIEVPSIGELSQCGRCG